MQGLSHSEMTTKRLDRGMKLSQTLDSRQDRTAPPEKENKGGRSYDHKLPALEAPSRWKLRRDSKQSLLLSTSSDDRN